MLKEEKKKEEREDPLEKLKEIESKYSVDYVDAPESLGLEKKEIEEKTYDDFFNEVSASHESKEDGLKGIEDSYTKKLELLAEGKDEAREKSSKKQEEINKIYDTSNKNVSDDALKRGLARSSIAISKIASVESDRAAALKQEYDDVNEKLKTIETQMNELSAAKEKALDEFDISYAKSIENEIAKKQAEYEKQKSEVIEFNNKVDEMEAEYKLSLDKQKQAKAKENMAMKEKYGYTADEVRMGEEKYNYMIGFLDKMTKEEALELLLSDEKLQKMLGSKFMAVYAYARNRKQ